MYTNDFLSDRCYSFVQKSFYGKCARSGAFILIVALELSAPTSSARSAEWEWTNQQSFCPRCVPHFTHCLFIEFGWNSPAAQLRLVWQAQTCTNIMSLVISSLLTKLSFSIRLENSKLFALHTDMVNRPSRWSHIISPEIREVKASSQRAIFHFPISCLSPFKSAWPF